MRNSKHTNPQNGYERNISRNKRYRFEGFAPLASVISKSAFQLLAILTANRSASRILAQQWPNSRKVESREDKTASNTPGRGQNRQRGSALDREGKNGRRQITGKGEVRLGRGAKQAKEKQTWQGTSGEQAWQGGQNGQGGGKRAWREEQNEQGAGLAERKKGGLMSDDLLSCLTAEKWAAKKMKPERKAPAFERNPDRLRALGNPLRFSRTLANYETVNLAKIVISVLQYIHCRTVENFTHFALSCNPSINHTRRLNAVFIGFELEL